MVFEDDPLSKKTRDPRDYRYLKLLRFTLKLLGAWPGRELNEGTTKYETAPLFFLMFVKISCLYLTLLYLREYSHMLGFFEIGHVYITVFMTFVTLSRGFSLPLNPNYRNVVKKYVTKMHLFYYKDDSEIALKTHMRVHKISHHFTMFLKFQMLAGLTLFNIIPMYNNYTAGRFQHKYLVNDTYDLSIYYKVPFNILTNLDGYIFICTFNWYASYICCNFFCMFDLILSLMIFTVTGHFKILIYNLNNFPLPAVASGSRRVLKTNDAIDRAQLYNKTEMADVTMRLNQCIDYHRELIEFTQDISEAFGPMLFAYYMFHQISGCLLLLECSQMVKLVKAEKDKMSKYLDLAHEVVDMWNVDSAVIVPIVVSANVLIPKSFAQHLQKLSILDTARIDAAALIRYGPLTLVLFQQLIQLSVVIESVGTVTGMLKDAVYSVPWEYMDTPNRKTMAIFLMNVQEPVHINALGLAKVGVQSMAAILKTSFSYFAFLRTVSE